MTLIELMVVVAIVAVLAAIATVSYMKQLKKGKISKLRQYALEVEKGQKQYASRNGRYLSIGSSYSNASGNDLKRWEQLLEFQHEDVKSTSIDVQTDAGGSGGSCSVCPGSWSPDTTENWYAVVVTQDLDDGVSTNTTVYLDNVRDTPVVIHEGH